MNPTTAAAAYKVATGLWSKYQERREEQALRDYSDIEEAAAQVRYAPAPVVVPESRRHAGAVTQAAHARVERALADLNSRRNNLDFAELKDTAAERFAEAKKEAGAKSEQLRKEAKKANKQARKSAAARSEELSKRSAAAKKQAAKDRKKAAKKAAKLRKKQQSNKALPTLGLLSVLAALGGGAYYYFQRNQEKASEVPPRVEEFSGQENTGEASTLVYTSTTEGTANHAPETTTVTSDMVEEGVVERDEGLLGSIDQQLDALRGEQPDDVNGQDTARLTDDHDDEGKHRLRTDDQK